jgi:hypothetical protein
VCSLRTWISRHPIRFVVYALVVSVAILAAADIWLLHGRLGGALAVRLAQLPVVRSVVQFRSARVACCETNCRLLAEVDGLSATPPATAKKDAKTSSGTPGGAMAQSPGPDAID